MADDYELTSKVLMARLNAMKTELKQIIKKTRIHDYWEPRDLNVDIPLLTQKENFQFWIENFKDFVIAEGLGDVLSEEPSAEYSERAMDERRRYVKLQLKEKLDREHKDIVEGISDPREMIKFLSDYHQSRTELTQYKTYRRLIEFEWDQMKSIAKNMQEFQKLRDDYLRFKNSNVSGVICDIVSKIPENFLQAGCDSISCRRGDVKLTYTDVRRKVLELESPKLEQAVRVGNANFAENSKGRKRKALSQEGGKISRRNSA